MKVGQQLYWIYTEGKSLIMKLSPDYKKIKVNLDLFSLNACMLIKYLWTFVRMKYKSVCQGQSRNVLALNSSSNSSAIQTTINTKYISKC